MMVIDKNLVHGTDTDPRLTTRAGVALTQATEDNVTRLTMDLEQSKRNVVQLKESLNKERNEGYKLKRKFEDMQNEVKTSKSELQTLQANKMTLEVSRERTGKDAQNNLA